MPKTKRVVLTIKDEVNIGNRLKKDKSGKKLAEEYGVELQQSRTFKKKKKRRMGFKVYFRSCK